MRVKAIGYVDWPPFLVPVSMQSNCKMWDSQNQRDHLVFIVRSESTQKHMLTEKDTTLSRFMQIALNLEAAQRNVQTFKKSEPTYHSKVDWRWQTAKKTSNKEEKPCYNCGKIGHTFVPLTLLNLELAKLDMQRAPADAREGSQKDKAAGDHPKGGHSG